MFEKNCTYANFLLKNTRKQSSLGRYSSPLLVDSVDLKKEASRENFGANVFSKTGTFLLVSGMFQPKILMILVFLKQHFSKPWLPATRISASIRQLADLMGWNTRADNRVKTRYRNYFFKTIVFFLEKNSVYQKRSWVNPRSCANICSLADLIGGNSRNLVLQLVFRKQNLSGGYSRETQIL